MKWLSECSFHDKAHIAFNEFYEPEKGASYYVVNEKPDDKCLLLIKTVPACTTLGFSFARLFERSKWTELVKTRAADWIKNALETHLVNECFTRNLETISAYSVTYHSRKVFQVLKNLHYSSPVNGVHTIKVGTDLLTITPLSLASQ